MKLVAVCSIVFALLCISSLSADFTKEMMDIFCPKERDSPKIKAAKLAYASCTLSGLFKKVLIVGPAFAACNKACVDELEADCGSTDMQKMQEHFCKDWKKEGENCKHQLCFQKCKDMAPKGDTSFHEKVVEACETTIVKRLVAILVEDAESQFCGTWIRPDLDCYHLQEEAI